MIAASSVKDQQSKSQITKPRRSLRPFIFCAGFVFCCLCFAVCPSRADEVTIIYSGQTHAMIYPCSCPKEPDGGIARRASLIKELKNSYPDALVLDSGAFFAGGLMDEYTQNTQLDMKRASINLAAMEAMGYDAAAISDDEFNFGADFLAQNISKSRIKFLSCNLSLGNILPYIIREASGVKIGVIAVTNMLSRHKSGAIEVLEPEAAVRQAVDDLNKKGINLIVLLSNLGEIEDLQLINDIKGIDIVIAGQSRSGAGPYAKVDDTLILRPSWQGRRLGRISFSQDKGKITSYKVEDPRLSEEVPDDKDTLSILPRCFSDANCRKEGAVGLCRNAGSPDADCEFAKAGKVKLSVITVEDCSICNADGVVNFLKGHIPGLDVSYLYYPERKAKQLIKKLSISGLPAFVLGKEVAQEKNFSHLEENLQLKDKLYVLKPEFAGLSFLLDRKIIKGKLDLFISLYDNNTPALLDAVREYNPDVHFLASSKQGKLEAVKGEKEVEEDLRAVCVQQYYPEKFWDYITCRSKNIDSSWWDNCISGIDLSRVKDCAKGEEGVLLLEDNTKPGRELHIMFGPTYLLDNYLIFSSKGAPTKETLEKILKR